jgi:hypothetical protein
MTKFTFRTKPILTHEITLKLFMFCAVRQVPAHIPTATLLIRYNNIEAYDNPPTRFGLFRYSTKKNTVMASYVIDLQ